MTLAGFGDGENSMGAWSKLGSSVGSGTRGSAHLEDGVHLVGSLSIAWSVSSGLTDTTYILYDVLHRLSTSIHFGGPGPLTLLFVIAQIAASAYQAVLALVIYTARKRGSRFTAPPDLLVLLSGANCLELLISSAVRIALHHGMKPDISKLCTSVLLGSTGQTDVDFWLSDETAYLPRSSHALLDARTSCQEIYATQSRVEVVYLTVPFLLGLILAFLGWQYRRPSTPDHDHEYLLPYSQVALYTPLRDGGALTQQDA
ncbi:unnamed protein product [Peniophora sp. CBMAI 1063]|nr:unnamed protein product [Peniophora sp. CBMAI 1063]